MIKVMATEASEAYNGVYLFILTDFAQILMNELLILLNLVAALSLGHELNCPNFNFKN